VDIAFDKLKRLQDVDSEINSISSLLEAIPAGLEDIDQQIKVASDVVSHAKEKLFINQKKRRDLEGQVKDNKAQIAKFKRQLNDVKTNKEYTSLLKEIEESQQKVDKVEEEILNEMIAADEIEKEIKAAHQKRTEEELRLKKEKEVISQNQKELEGKKQILVKERENLIPQIPPDQLRLYLRISKKMSGIGLSPVTDDFCSLCQMRIRPQLLNELVEKKKIILCEACGRILNWQKPHDEGEEEEKVDDPNKVDDSTA
jgi:predicted  nucleic acid-binding Zn-ribbon protein